MLREIVVICFAFGVTDPGTNGAKLSISPHSYILRWLKTMTCVQICTQICTLVLQNMKRFTVSNVSHAVCQACNRVACSESAHQTSSHAIAFAPCTFSIPRCCKMTLQLSLHKSRGCRALVYLCSSSRSTTTKFETCCTQELTLKHFECASIRRQAPTWITSCLCRCA